MGNCNCADTDDHVVDSVRQVEKVSVRHFEYKYCIGRGGFGKVWKVQHKKDSKIYAMKEM